MTLEEIMTVRTKMELGEKLYNQRLIERKVYEELLFNLGFGIGLISVPGEDGETEDEVNPDG